MEEPSSKRRRATRTVLSGWSCETGRGGNVEPGRGTPTEGLAPAGSISTGPAPADWPHEPRPVNSAPTGVTPTLKVPPMRTTLSALLLFAIACGGGGDPAAPETPKPPEQPTPPA